MRWESNPLFDNPNHDFNTEPSFLQSSALPDEPYSLEDEDDKGSDENDDKFDNEVEGLGEKLGRRQNGS